MQFDKITEFLFNQLIKNEDLNVNLDSENSTFVRFNNSQVRQATHVDQNVLTLTMRDQSKEAKVSVNITGELNKDKILLSNSIRKLRSEVKILTPHPRYTPFKNNGTSQKISHKQLPTDKKILNEIFTVTKGCDFAGFLAKGPMIRANANSKGQKHWFEINPFFLDYSIYNGPKAVKGCYANSEWNSNELEQTITESKYFLNLMNKPVQKLERGKYRTYLAPAAMAEIVGLLKWGAFSYENFKAGNSAFKKLYEKESILSSHFSIRENFSLGMSPLFNDLGESGEELVNLITNGLLKNFLISSKSSHQFNIPTNFASSSESPRAAEILPGTLKREDIFKELDSGVYLSNLHYLNWSDLNHARVTGMTRYACFLVEDGEIKGPIQDMRFDESLFDLFGKNLVNLTNFQTFDTDVSTYFNRNVGGSLLPGLLAKEFTFTL